MYKFLLLTIHSSLKRVSRWTLALVTLKNPLTWWRCPLHIWLVWNLKLDAIIFPACLIFWFKSVFFFFRCWSGYIHVLHMYLWWKQVRRNVLERLVGTVLLREYKRVKQVTSNVTNYLCWRCFRCMRRQNGTEVFKGRPTETLTIPSTNQNHR